MSKIPGLSTLRDDSSPVDLPTPSPEIQRLFELALQGGLPRNREPAPWAPQRLNERHLVMVMMRAAGLMQRDIARTLEVTDSNVSIVLNHPDAEYLLSRLAAVRFALPTEYERRLSDLSEKAVDVIEGLLNDEEVPAFKRAPSAFKLLEMNGHSRRAKPAPQEHVHTHQIEGSGPELALLAKALRETRAIPETQYVDVTPDPGGELVADPPSLLLPPSGGVRAPSFDGSQDTPTSEDTKDA